MGTYQGNQLTRDWSENALSQSSHFAEPAWTDPGLKSGISVYELISTLKKKKTVQEGTYSHILITNSVSTKTPVHVKLQ